MNSTGFLSRGRALATAVAVTAAVMIAAAGCTNDSTDSTSSKQHTTPTPATVRPTDNPAASPVASSAPIPAGNPAQPPIADLQAIVATGQASVSQVVQLHDVAVAAGNEGTIPPAVIPQTAKNIASTLQQQSDASTRLDPAAGTPQADLAAALQQYAALAGQLADWDPVAAKPLPAAFFTELAAADTDWQAAAARIGAVANVDLLAGMSPLLFPKG